MVPSTVRISSCAGFPRVLASAENINCSTRAADCLLAQGQATFDATPRHFLKSVWRCRSGELGGFRSHSTAGAAA